VGQDGWENKVIWGLRKIRIFLNEGWTRRAVNGPDDLPVRQSVGLIEVGMAYSVFVTTRASGA
jgi:hypothetical protein